MAETAAHLVDHVNPRVPVRQWVLSFPIPLRFLLAAQPYLISPVLRVVNRTIATFLIQQAGLKRSDAQTGAVTLIQRFGSAANLNIHLHCLYLDGVYDTCTYRIALGPRAGQKVLTLRTVPSSEAPNTSQRCANEQGFSLHAHVRCAMNQRNQLERLCRYITRPAIANERLTIN